MGWTWKKTAVLVCGTIAGTAAIALTGGLLAPAIGGIIGSAMGLSGAAATSAGLATLGGGSLAVGGGGMAAGTAAIVGAGAAVGAVAGGVASGLAVSTLDDVRKCKNCKAHLSEDDKFCPQCGGNA